MSHLRNKYRALLGAFSKQDNDVWSGSVKDNNYAYYPDRTLNNSGVIASGTTIKSVVVLKIPKGANSVVLKGNGSSFSVSTSDNTGSGLTDQRADNIYGDFRDATISIPNLYSDNYLFVSIRKTTYETATFEFSK